MNQVIKKQLMIASKSKVSSGIYYNTGRLVAGKKVLRLRLAQKIAHSTIKVLRSESSVSN